MLNIGLKSGLKVATAVSASALLLAACAGNQIETLETSKVTGDEYRDKLAANYLEFARYEYEKMYDETDAAYFAGKGKAVLDGSNVAPENPAKWNISNKEMMSDLQGGRGRLIQALHNGAAEKMPAAAARALVSYDCWVEQAEEGWQYTDIKGCREGFMRALAVVDKGMAKPAAAVVVEPKPEKKMVKPAPAATPPAQYLLFFDWDSATLTETSRDIIRTAAQNAARTGITSFEIVGHADASGPSDYNDRLSVRRAEAVADALVRMGYFRSNVTVIGRGERDLLVSTNDGVREPQNRRVLLKITDRRVGT